MGIAAFDIDGSVRRIADHPQPGMLFYDLMPLFQSGPGLTACVDRLADWSRLRQPEVVLGIEARGFILGGAIAQSLGVGFAAARKRDKLPGVRIGRDYDARVRGGHPRGPLRRRARPGQKVLVHDDLLATGGTARAACELVEELGGVVVGVAVVVELTFLSGRDALRGYDVVSLVTYDSEDVPR